MLGIKQIYRGSHMSRMASASAESALNIERVVSRGRQNSDAKAALDGWMVMANRGSAAVRECQGNQMVEYNSRLSYNVESSI